MSTKSEQLVVLHGANRVQTLFLRCDEFIEIWFLNENWIQNLNFRKNSLSTKRLLEKKFSKPARTKNSRFKNWSICGKTLHFKIRIFFQKIPFQTLIFNEKACFKIMPLKISTKSEKLVFSAEEIKLKRYFLDVMFWSKSDFSIKIEIENWVSGKLFFSKIWLFEKLFIIKSVGTKSSQFKTWSFGNFSFQIFIVQENVCFRIWFFLFQKFHFKLWFSIKKFATK